MKNSYQCPNRSCGSLKTKKYYTIPTIAKSRSEDHNVEPKFDYWVYICKDCGYEFKIKCD